MNRPRHHHGLSGQHAILVLNNMFGANTWRMIFVVYKWQVISMEIKKGDIKVLSPCICHEMFT
jgi:hypothetical protein